VTSSTLWRGVALAFALIGCGTTPHEGAAAHTTLGGDVVARVGGIDIRTVLVGAVAADHRIAPPAALELLVDDAVAAKGAEARRLGDTADARFAQLAVLARATLAHIRAEARRAPPTDDEVRSMTAAHWLEVDVPETLVVVHSVARRPKPPDARAEAAAKAVAAAIAAAEVGATDADDFQARANAVPHAGVEVVTQLLQPFTVDGRVAAPGAPSGLYSKFAAGAAALVTPGETSGVVESEAGWHVIRLLARRPAISVAFDERRRLFAAEIYDRRTRDAVDALEATLRAREPVSRANGVDDLLNLAVPATSSGADPPALGTP